MARNIYQLVCKKCKNVWQVATLGASPNTAELKCPKCGWGIPEKTKIGESK